MLKCANFEKQMLRLRVETLISPYAANLRPLVGPLRSCPRRHLTSPRFLILMAINRFCSVSTVSALSEGQEKEEEGARESVQAGEKIVRQRERERGGGGLRQKIPDN